MKTRYLLSMILLVCVAGVGACGGSQPEPIPPTEQPKQDANPTPPAEKFIAGQLQAVDLEAKTLVLRDLQGAEQTFAFSEKTSVTGVPSAKDLLKQEGRNATIRYVELDNRKSAVQIHIELGS